MKASTQKELTELRVLAAKHLTATEVAIDQRSNPDVLHCVVDLMEVIVQIGDLAKAEVEQ